MCLERRVCLTECGQPPGCAGTQEQAEPAALPPCALPLRIQWLTTQIMSSSWKALMTNAPKIPPIVGTYLHFSPVVELEVKSSPAVSCGVVRPVWTGCLPLSRPPLRGAQMDLDNDWNTGGSGEELCLCDTRGHPARWVPGINAARTRALRTPRPLGGNTRYGAQTETSGGKGRGPVSARCV